MTCQDPLVRKWQSQMANPNRLVFKAKPLKFMPRSRHQDTYLEAYSSYHYLQMADKETGPQRPRQNYYTHTAA
jgi:hypothetical protein